MENDPQQPAPLTRAQIEAEGEANRPPAEALAAPRPTAAPQTGFSLGDVADFILDAAETVGDVLNALTDD